MTFRPPMDTLKLYGQYKDPRLVAILSVLDAFGIGLILGRLAA